MAMPSYLYLDGETQGKIDGSCTIQGHEKAILVQMVDCTIEIPKNPQTGLPSGKRKHLGMKITKDIDKSSPKIMQALCAGEHMKTVDLKFYRITKDGKEEEYYKITLTNAIIVDTRVWVPNCLEETSKPMGQMEDVTFTYEKITWTWVPDGIEAEDSWEVPKA